MLFKKCVAFLYLTPSVNEQHKVAKRGDYPGYREAGVKAAERVEHLGREYEVAPCDSDTAYSYDRNYHRCKRVAKTAKNA